MEKIISNILIHLPPEKETLVDFPPNSKIVSIERDDPNRLNNIYKIFYVKEE
jgi:hypothetical protein